MKINFRVLLIGCGNIGIRHLESLLQINKKNLIIELIVLEIKKSKIVKIKRFIESNKNKNLLYKVYSTFPVLKQTIDLAIISSDSSSRIDVLKKLLPHNIRHLVMEKLISNNFSNLRKINYLIKKSRFENTYINTPRRFMSDYIKLKRKLNFNHPIIVESFGSNIKLASNSIHIIDLFQFLLNDKKITCISCNISKISQTNSNYHEFEGSIVFKDNKNNFLYINNLKQNNKSLSNFGGIKIYNHSKSFIINESFGEIIELTQNIKNKKININKKKFNNLPQSILTGLYVDKIFTKQKLNLPGFDTSYFAHKLFFESLNRELKRNNINEYNIT